jgi:hypothetical protein
MRVRGADGLFAQLERAAVERPCLLEVGLVFVGARQRRHGRGKVAVGRAEERLVARERVLEQRNGGVPVLAEGLERAERSHQRGHVEAVRLVGAGDGARALVFRFSFKHAK